jgi:hypothetical protein
MHAHITASAVRQPAPDNSRVGRQRAGAPRMSTPVQTLTQSLLQASAVVGMLERRVGEDMFKRLLERHVVASCHAAHKGARRARPGPSPAAPP